MFESFHFLRPTALLLAPVAVAAWWFWRRRADPLRGWRAQVDPDLLTALSDSSAAPPHRHAVLLTAWLLAVVAIAGPSWKPEPSPFAEDVSPLIILLKADASMDTPDPEPSRIERAHLKIRDLAKARKGKPLGLIAYAGSAHLVLPPTKDTDAVATMAAEVSSRIMPLAGDRPDLAIARAEDLLEKEGGTLLILTDAATLATPALGEAFQSAKKPYVQILAVAAPGADVASLDPFADTLDADVVAMTTDDSDIERIVRRAKRPPVSRAADGSERWQDGGYYLVPALALIALLPFRRETKRQPA
ncbi:MAG: VWA domain-containing protein [Akkermansiaceae bacterium]|nr:VWA domain-containing protein [Akkermansiaceae bacterium]MCP5545843.1 VWA domain-containing protein [Akkermansiaceae bacterium]